MLKLQEQYRYKKGCKNAKSKITLSLFQFDKNIITIESVFDGFINFQSIIIPRVSRLLQWSKKLAKSYILNATDVRLSKGLRQSTYNGRNHNLV